jgi:hypothetical protein
MIRPVAFRMNEQTVINNYYQNYWTISRTVNAKTQGGV